MAAKKPAKRRKALKSGKKLNAQKTLTEFTITKHTDASSTNLF